MDTIIIDGLSFALPLFIMAIGGIYSEKSGITNLALEGFQGFGAFIGALSAVLIANAYGTDVENLFYVALLFAMIGGMGFSVIHAVLSIKFKANQVISGVVINILALALTTFLTTQINALVFGAASDKFRLGVSERFTIEGLADIPVIGAVFTDVYPFQVIIIVIAIFAWYVLYKTRFGLHLRASGENPHSVDAAGVDVAKIRFSAVLISGLLSGLAGMCFAYSISAQFSSSIYMGYGFLAIAALIFGNWKILPTLAACLLFGFAKSGGTFISQALALPSSFTDLFMILPYVLTLLLLIFFSKSNQAPRALGEIYDKGKR
ncbi:ABC transporter permease [Oceanobacillus luteolus]|uniref:ABC transporter permease n=1 Tax=Oceanobacillus luteolus TaxID=1274358 RepID=A0ABW4HQU6_9BACI|nr:ABC transporter permease [Oceanobacillus luteolus]MCM3741754.1 ABC transporter permease [Oceanobacillus luteolus]